MNNEKIPDVLFLDANHGWMDGWMFIEEYVRIKKDLRLYVKLFGEPDRY
jgi:hypothetical protein